MSVNPFGNESAEKSAVDILKESFRIVVDDYDRGYSVWMEESYDDEGNLRKPGFYHQPIMSREVVLSFTTTQGQGTGSFTIPASEYFDVLNAMQAIHDSGYDTVPEVDNKYVPTNEWISRTFKMTFPKKYVLKDGKRRKVSDKSKPASVVSIRAAGGKGRKGVKPIYINSGDEYLSVLGLLRAVGDNLDQHVDNAWREFANNNPDADIPYGVLSDSEE